MRGEKETLGIGKRKTPIKSVPEFASSSM